MADKKIKIPMLGKTESLNASVATGIILYEYVRQKLSKQKEEIIMINIVLVEPEIPQNTRKYCKNLCNNRC